MFTLSDYQRAAQLMRSADLDELSEALDSSDVVIGGRVRKHAVPHKNPGKKPAPDQA